MSDKNILVLGLGNLLLSDEGVGIHVIRELQKRSLPKNILLVDGGTGGFELIRYFPGKEKVIILDAMKSEQRPGSVFRIALEDLGLTESHPFSSHQGGLTELLTEINNLNPMPEIIIYGIAVGEIGQYNMKLSRDVNRAIPALISLILRELDNGMN